MNLEDIDTEINFHLRMRLEAIATRINFHFKIMQNNPEINILKNGLPQLDNARAYRFKKHIRICYRSSEEPCKLKKDEAIKYLAWLDAGNYTSHFNINESEIKNRK